MRAAALLLAALLAASPAGAVGGRTSGGFLQRTLGAKAAAMGNAFVAVSESPDSIQYNPAALSTISRPVLSTTYLNAFGSTNYGFLGYVHPLPLGVGAVSAVYFNAGTIDLNLSDGTTGRVTAEEDLATTASYAFPLPLGFSVGATYRFVRLKLAESVSATTHQGDLGAHWETPFPGISLGASYQYIGADITFEEAGDPPPRTIRYGFAIHLDDVNIRKLDPSVDLKNFEFTFTGDVVQVLHEDPSIRFGTELGIIPDYMNGIALRFGWIFGRFAESATAGIGFKGKHYDIDYAFGSSSSLGNLQHLTFTHYFNNHGS
ncbi:MAG: hypothetical protein COB53_07110 [Elusimicrobia bacterium]|nr:MAG: hypothetical protein COB53_07110 [Elusimicrobiota bacterium]